MDLLAVLWIQDDVDHPPSLDVQVHDVAPAVPHSYFVPPFGERVEERRMDRSVREKAGTNGGVGAVPRGTSPTDLELRPGEQRRSPHDRGTDVPSDVEHCGPGLTGLQMMVHHYGATEVRVFDGFENPL